jgi:hypothetical protein
LRKNKIIILEDCKFDWKQEQIEHAKRLFNQGISPSEVAQIMNEKVIDIGLLLIHLIDTNQLTIGVNK